MKKSILSLVLIFLVPPIIGQPIDSISNRKLKFQLSHADLSLNAGFFNSEYYRVMGSIAVKMNNQNSIALRIREDYMGKYNKKIGFGPSFRHSFFPKSSSPYIEYDFSILRITDKTIDFEYFGNIDKFIDSYKYWGAQTMFYFGYSHQIKKLPINFDAKYGFGYIYYEKYAVTRDPLYYSIIYKFWQKKWYYQEFFSIGISYYFYN